MFKVGEKIVCVKKQWNPSEGCEPKYNEIVTVSDYGDEGYVMIQGYCIDYSGNIQQFSNHGFRKLKPNFNNKLTKECIMGDKCICK